MTKKKAQTPVETVIAYKGFDANLICNPTGSNPFQYEIGKTYTHKGPIVRCKSGGFHACESPLDVFGYYAPATSRYAEVAMSGQIDRDVEDTKIAAAQITVNLELKIPDLVKRAVDWVMAKIDTKIEQAIINNAATNTGNQSAATNTGYRSAATNTGYRSAATNTGDQSAATVEGKDSVAIATGYRSKAKACAGSAIVLVYRDDNMRLVHIRAGIAGKDVKADVFYVLDANGDFQEAA